MSIRRALPYLAALALTMSCSSGPDPVEADLARAKTAYQAGDLDTAEESAESAWNARPEDNDAKATLASVYRRRGRIAADEGKSTDAYRAFQAASRVEPYRAARARDLLAAITHGEQAGMTSKELADIAASAVAADPANPDARAAAARHLDNAGRQDDALPHYLWLWEADGSDARISLRLATLYANSGEHDDAIVVYERILSGRPKNVQASLGLAASLEAEGLNRKARRVFENLLANNEGNPGILFRFADFLERRGDEQRAEILRGEARESMPGVDRRKMRELR